MSKEAVTSELPHTAESSSQRCVFSAFSFFVWVTIRKEHPSVSRSWRSIGSRGMRALKYPSRPPLAGTRSFKGSSTTSDGCTRSISATNAASAFSSPKRKAFPTLGLDRQVEWWDRERHKDAFV